MTAPLPPPRPPPLPQPLRRYRLERNLEACFRSWRWCRAVFSRLGAVGCCRKGKQEVGDLAVRCVQLCRLRDVAYREQPLEGLGRERNSVPRSSAGRQISGASIILSRRRDSIFSPRS